MCARLDFPSQALKAPVTVPASAVHELEGRSSIFVELGQGRFEVRAVDLGARDETSIQVKKGLAAGDRVVGKNSLSLKAEWLNK
ncbi:MAG: hypothetical protein JRF33_16045 [Deltaproteobacteria bacterium]|nr:hypothetical protein [Deltaproteobacteria bacterium]